MGEAARETGNEERLPAEAYGKCERALYRYPLRKARLAELTEPYVDIIRGTSSSDTGPVSAPAGDPTGSRGVALAALDDRNELERRSLARSIRQVDDVIATLTDDQRTIVELKYWRGWDIEAVRRELHISRATYHRYRTEIVLRVAERLGLMPVRQT